jgi:hypothetical protein
MQFQAAFSAFVAGTPQFRGMGLEMLGIHEFWLFFVFGLLLNVTARADMAYVGIRVATLQARSIL